MAVCRHLRVTGIVTNQDPIQPLDAKRAHASVSTCERETCIAGCQRWVASETNETATYFSFADIREGRLAANEDGAA